METAAAASPVVTPVPAPIEAASAVTEVAQRPEAFGTVATRAPRANGLSVSELQPMLESAGLVWVNTDEQKLHAAREAAARAPAPAHVPRERKPLPPVDLTPMQQIETRKDA